MMSCPPTQLARIGNAVWLASLPASAELRDNLPLHELYGLTG